MGRTLTQFEKWLRAIGLDGYGGGILLFVPGFISDAFGLLLLFPPTRHVARAFLKQRFRTRVYRYGPGPAAGNIIDV